MKHITDLESMYPTTRVYKNNEKGFPIYTIKDGSAKRADGSKKNMYIQVRFGKDAPEFDNNTDMVIKNSFKTGKVVTNGEGKEITYEWYQVMAYEIVGELPFEEVVSNVVEEKDDDWD